MPWITSLRKVARRGSQPVDLASEILDVQLEAVPASGFRTPIPSRVLPPPPWPLGALSSSRSSPRESMANGGAGRMTTSKPRFVV